jgi:UDP-N-acetylmuramoylalanine--D-glutamate ligase
MHHQLAHKKIGIWGFGIVGQSILKFIQRYTNQIQIMDQKELPSEFAHQSFIKQNTQTIRQFLTDNDIIIASPGIKLHDWQEFAHKFVHELDIFAQHFSGKSIGITGTVGKTTITSLIAQAIPQAIAAGNIGNPMLNALHAKTVVLELSSYQLHWAQNFAPDVAIWTNFYPNHLDHHQNLNEYFDSKCNLLKNQTSNQIALLPANLWPKIQEHVQTQAQIFLFNENEIVTELPLFFLKNNQLILKQNNEQKIIFDEVNKLPAITFQQNWIIILAALHLTQNLTSQTVQKLENLQPEPHRLEFVKMLNGTAVYNDSKSTIWQATEQALKQFENKKIALFLGGLSKGTDRTPLIESLQYKPVTVFAFGKEAPVLQNICKTLHVVHYATDTLQEALIQFQTRSEKFDVLLFSPAGASYDLFKDFSDRGNQFKELIKNFSNL